LSANFTLTFCAALLFYGSMYFLVPVMPVYLKGQGLSIPAIGAVVGAFAATSIVLRPFFGRLADKLPKRALMAAGAAVFTAAPLMYTWTDQPWLLAAVRLIHGSGIAAFATASAVLIANGAPRERLAQALGIYFTAVSLAMGLGPLAGARLMQTHSFGQLMLAASLSSALALVLVFFIRENRLPQAAPKPSLPYLSVVKNTAVVVPTLIMISCSFAFGTITAFLPLHVLGWSRPDPGPFFLVSSAVLVVVRLLAGGVSDRHGRGTVLLPSLLLTALSVGLLSLTRSAASLMMTAVLFGAGYALAYPTLNAMAVEHCPPEARGTAYGIFSVSADAGAFLGPVVCGILGHFLPVADLFAVAAAAPLGGLALYRWSVGQPGTQPNEAKSS